MNKIKTITLGTLKKEMEWMWNAPDNTLITFGGGDLSLLKVKGRKYREDAETPEVVQFEFSELYSITHD